MRPGQGRSGGYTMPIFNRARFSAVKPWTRKPLESFEKALKISEGSGDDDGIMNSLFWIGKTYSWLRDPEKAAEYLNRTRRMAAENRNEGMETDHFTGWVN